MPHLHYSSTFATYCGIYRVIATRGANAADAPQLPINEIIPV